MTASRVPCLYASCLFLILKRRFFVDDLERVSPPPLKTSASSSFVVRELAQVNSICLWPLPLH
jgi:hypothetical protein